MDKIFKALADRNRRFILTLLRNGPLSVGSIVARMDISQATVSSHLAVLKKSGLVVTEIKDRWRIYRLNEEVVKKFVIELNKFSDMDVPKAVDEIIVRR